MKPPAPTTIRRLGHPQMAFVRSWAEGLDLVDAWNRYLYVDGAGDGRRARGELKRLLDELGGIARANGRPELAVLLRRDPEAIVDAGPQPPSLEEFAALQPPDFYSEAELIGWLHEAADAGIPVILNPAAFTHYSYGVRDAAAQLTAPLIEVHISNPATREEFRHTSVIAGVATGTIAGFGVSSYLLAVDALVALDAG